MNAREALERIRDRVWIDKDSLRPVLQILEAIETEAAATAHSVASVVSPILPSDALDKIERLCDGLETGVRFEIQKVLGGVEEAAAQSARNAIISTVSSKHPEDGTARLCSILYGEEKPEHYLGGSNARMLHDAVDRIEELRASKAAVRRSQRGLRKERDRLLRKLSVADRLRAQTVAGQTTRVIEANARADSYITLIKEQERTIENYRNGIKETGDAG